MQAATSTQVAARRAERRDAPFANRNRRGGGAVPASLVALALLAGCKEPALPRYDFDSAAMERGREVIERVGCAACHEIPGIDWPKGRLGTSLKGFDDIGLIAGALPNDAENLASFVRNAPATKPGSTMPAMPITAEEARDVAAYLYGMNDV